MKKYIPINCDYHSIIESYATLKTQVRLIFRTPQGSKEVNTIIKDVYTRYGEEFIITSEDEEIRLDMIISIDGNDQPEQSCS